MDRFILAGKAWIDVHWVYRQELDALASFWNLSQQLDISYISRISNAITGSMSSLRAPSL